MDRHRLSIPFYDNKQVCSCRSCNGKLGGFVLCAILLSTLLFLLVILQRIFIGYDVENQLLKLAQKGLLPSNDKRLLNHIRQNYLIPPSTNEYNLSHNANYKLVAKSYTWNFINSKLQEYFGKQKEGFFVEAGALDGEVLSNTLWLEKKGWGGLLVEPDPANFRSLQRKNRKAWISKSCLSLLPYPTKTIFSTVSVEKQKIQDNWDKKGLARNVDGENIFTYFSDNVFSTMFFNVYFPTMCFPLESLLLAMNVTVVDFLSLDIQGGEWQVLKMFPFDKVKIRAIAVEYVTQEDEFRLTQDFIDFMSDKGYKLVGTSFVPDYFFILRQDPRFKAQSSNPLYFRQ